MINPLMNYADERRWVNWRSESRDGRPTKIPYQPCGIPASTTDPTTWSKMSELCNESGLGVGIVFTPDRLLLAVDGDQLLADGKISDPIFESFVNAADTYCEISPSGTGLHVYLALNSSLELIANRHGHFECYSSDRYFTCTFNPYCDKPIRVVTPEDAVKLLGIIGYPWGKAPTNNAGIDTAKPATMPLADDDLLRRMFASKNGARIKALFNGDTTAYTSPSEADMALVSHLVWWTNRDAAQIERIWLQSKLSERDKTQQRKGYRDTTIKAALALVTGGYTGNGAHEPGSDVDMNAAPDDRGTNTGEPSDGTMVSTPGDQSAAAETTGDKKRSKATLHTDDELADEWCKLHLNTAFGIGEFRRYSHGVWPVTPVPLVESEILDVLRTAKVYGIRPTARLLASVEKLASITVSVDDTLWNADPDVIVCANGTLQIPTMTMREHRLEDYQTSGLAFNYDPSSSAPLWKYALDSTVPEAADFLQEFAGYALTIDTQYELAVWLYGPSGSGRSTILTGFQTMLGDRCGLLGLADIERSTFGLQNLPGKTLVVSTEQPADFMRSSHIVNAIISGERVPIDRKFRDRIEIDSHAKVAWAMNDLPRVPDAGNGLFRRVQVIKFPVLKPEDRDPAFKEGIKSEGAGILNWALTGLAIPQTGINCAFNASETA